MESNIVDLQERTQQYKEENKELLKKYGLKSVITIDFPQYKILPAKVQLAMQILQEEGIKITTVFEDTKPEEKGVQ